MVVQLFCVEDMVFGRLLKDCGTDLSTSNDPGKAQNDGEETDCEAEHFERRTDILHGGMALLESMKRRTLRRKKSDY